MNEAYFRAEVLEEIRSAGARFCTHRMEAGEVGSNKVLHHGEPWVAEDADARCCKEMADANTRQAADQEAHEVGVPGNHSMQAEEVHGCCCMDLGTLLRNRKGMEQKNCDVDLSNHLLVDESAWM